MTKAYKSEPAALANARHTCPDFEPDHQALTALAPHPIRGEVPGDLLSNSGKGRLGLACLLAVVGTRIR